MPSGQARHAEALMTRDRAREEQGGLRVSLSLIRRSSVTVGPRQLHGPASRHLGARAIALAASENPQAGSSTLSALPAQACRGASAGTSSAAINARQRARSI